MILKEACDDWNLQNLTFPKINYHPYSCYWEYFMMHTVINFRINLDYFFLMNSWKP